MRGQAAYARQVLDAIPGRKRLSARIAQLSGDAVVTRSVQSCRGRIFYEKRPLGADNFKLYTRAQIQGEERLLIETEHRSSRTVATSRWIGGAQLRTAAM